MLVQKNVYVKILLHTNIPARKAALVRNYYFRRNNFGVHSFWLPFVSCSAIFDQIKAEILFKSNFHVSFNVSVPCFNMNGS